MSDSAKLQMLDETPLRQTTTRLPPPPPLPASVVDATSKRYLEAYRLITGANLEIG